MSPEARSREVDPLPVEEDAIQAGMLWRVALTGVVVAIVAVLVARALLHGWSQDASVAAPPKIAPAQIGIVEQTPILVSRRGLDERAAQRESLRHFGWADADHQVARLPIDQAMDLVTDPAFMRRAFARDGGE